MGDIRSNIRRLRCRNSDGQYFVPIASYLEYMSRNTVTEALTEGGTEAWKIDEMISIAMEGARQLLGILVMIRWEKLFVAFVEQHQGDSKTLDAQLPFTKERLFFVDPHIAEEFLENQWIFVSPVFSVRLTHRYFHDETILPFVENSPLDEGGFGRVFLVKVHAGHHNYGDDFQSQVKHRFVEY
jgi:hypothetical protein